MQYSERPLVRLGWVLYFSFAFFLLLVHVSHSIGGGESVETFVYGILIPIGTAVGLLVGGVKIRTEIRKPEDVFRLVVWVFAGALVLTTAGVVTILLERAHGVTMVDPAFVVANMGTGGALLGMVIGLYQIRQLMASRRAQRLNRQLTVLNRVLRHDLRNKANIIKGNASLLTELESPIGDHAQTIQSEAADLAGFGERAKQLERIFQQEDFELEEIELGRFVDAAREEIEREFPAATVEVRVPATLSVLGHPAIEFAVTHVLENAVEHNDLDHPRIAIESGTVTQDGTEYIELRIADNGPGIPASETEVLERGYETDLEHMSGLGLWTVHWIVSNLGGRVRFEANEPRGSIVVLQLPAAQTA